MSNLNTQLQAAIQAAFQNAPAVRQHFDQAGLTPSDIQTIADLHKIPILPKDDIIALQQSDPPFGGMLGVPLTEVKRIYLSPGPIHEPDSGDNSHLVEMTKLALQRAGFTADEMVLNTLSYHLVPAGLMLDDGATALGCTVVPSGVGNSDLQIKLMKDLGVTAYIGTPSFLLNLLRKAEEAGILADLKLTKAFVTAEPLFPDARRALTETYKLTVCNGYATAELGVLATNTDGARELRLMPQPIVQIVAPDTGQPVGAGETGEVVVTNFNRAYPLIRFGTGDMAINIDPNPGASRQEERAIILVGRSGDAVKVRGMFVHPNQLKAEVGQVTQASVQGIVTRQDGRDHFTVQLAFADSEVETATLIEPLHEAIRQICRVRADEIVFVDAFASDARGMVDQREW